MTRNIRHIFLLLVGLLFAFPALAAQSVHVSVQAGTRSGAIEVGEKFYIYVVVKNVGAEPSPITSAGGAEVVYWTRSATSSSTVVVNGHATTESSDTYAATLIARKKGSYSFGPITVGGVKSNVVKYNIVDAGAGGTQSATATSSQAVSSTVDPTTQQSQAPDPNQSGPTFIGKGNEQLFMRANVSKTTAYEQEALVYTVKLYSTYGSIKFIGATDAPKFDGFVIEESNDVSKSLTFENYQGRTYATAVIARYIIFPQMSGKLKIIGNKYTVSTDAHEYYHDPYFSTLTVRRPIQLNVTPNDLVVDVKALPSPRPANFSGGVGRFTITSNLNNNSLIANQAASITYTVSGEGNLKYVRLPDLNALYPDQLEVFTPTTDVKTNVSGSNVSGSVKFDYSFMPLEQGKFTIPEVELCYFNPGTGRYETVKTRSYNVDVAVGSESSKSQATLTFDSKLMSVNVDKASSDKPYIRGFAYWLWFIVPTLILVCVAISRRKYLADRADIVGMKSRRAGKMAKKRLKRAFNAMKKNNEDLFYTEILKAVWGYLSDKLRLPTSELNRDNVTQLLMENEIPNEDIERLVKLLDDAEFAKYSPASLRRPMSEIYDQSVELLNMLEESFSKAGAKKVQNPDDQNPSGPANTGAGEMTGTSDLTGKVLGVIAMLLISLSAMAVNPSALVAEGDSAYAKRDYEKAVNCYSQVIKESGSSAPLLFNLGCAYYKMGNEGEARLALERAKKLDPSNSQINQNIRYIAARVQDANKAELKGKKGDIAPEEVGFFGRLHNKIAADTSSNAWAGFAAMSFILTLCFVAFYLFVNNVKIRKTGFFCSIIFFVFSIIFIILSEMAASHFLSKDEAIITAFKTELIADPGDSTKTVGSPLTRGTKLQILESRLNADGEIGWYKVKLNSTNIGWIDASAISII